MRLSNFLSAFLANRSGNVAVSATLAMIPLLGLGGLAFDYSHVANRKSGIQQLLDAAVLAGARMPDGQQIAESGKVFAALAERAAIADITAKFEIVPISTGGARLVGKADLTVPSKFGWGNYPAWALSEVWINSPGVASSACYLVLDPSGSQALLANSGATISAPNCQIDVKSSANPAAIVNAGTNLSIKKLCIAGDKLFNTTQVPPYQVGCSTSGDPLAGKLPVPSSASCTVNNQTFDPTGSTREVSPGVWCGWNNFNGTQSIRFKPGVYVIRDGDITINSGSTVSGTDVTFYFVGNTNLRFNGNVNVDLAAPTSGTWAGILFAEAAGSSKAQFIFNGVKGKLSGQIYLPNREVVLNSTSQISLNNFRMISHRLILDQSEWKVVTSYSGGAGSSGISANNYLSK